MPRAHRRTFCPRVEVLEDRCVLAGPDRPNILLLLTDDQRADTIPYMPTVSSLRAVATEFTSALVTTSRCCPSRASIFTGQYASTHGVTTTELAGLFPEERSVVIPLQESGYYTAFIGKYFNGYSGGRVPPGWDRFAGFVGGSEYYNGPKLWMHRDGVDLGEVHHAAAYSTDLFARKAAHWLSQFEANDSQPWFLEVAFTAPHGPRTPAARHANLEFTLPDPAPSVPDGAFLTEIVLGQLRTLRAVDEAVYSLVTQLEELKELDDTLVIYTSDNGYLWGEHGERSKAIHYEEAHRVPLLVVAGWNLVPSTVDSVVGNIDFAPTFLDYAQLPIPPHVEGVSLRASIDEKQDRVERKGVFLEGPDAEVLVGSPRIGYRGVHNRRWVFFLFKDGHEELFDLRTDPFELNNLAEDPAEKGRVERLRDLVSSRPQI